MVMMMMMMMMMMRKRRVACHESIVMRSSWDCTDVPVGYIGTIENRSLNVHQRGYESSYECMKEGSVRGVQLVVATYPGIMQRFDRETVLW